VERKCYRLSLEPLRLGKQFLRGEQEILIVVSAHSVVGEDKDVDSFLFGVEVEDSFFLLDLLVDRFASWVIDLEPFI
jgi:hypothetical protein